MSWTAQPVIYNEDAPHYMGSDHVGSDTGEREALFWSALWRLAQNANVPTTLCPDSVTSELQGMGVYVYGAVEATCSFRLLRAAFQSLESALGRAGLSTSHVKGHSGDAWNDLVDLLAKQERVKSTMKNHNY